MYLKSGRTVSTFSEIWFEPWAANHVFFRTLLLISLFCLRLGLSACKTCSSCRVKEGADIAKLPSALSAILNWWSLRKDVKDWIEDFIEHWNKHVTSRNWKYASMQPSHSWTEAKFHKLKRRCSWEQMLNWERETKNSQILWIAISVGRSKRGKEALSHCCRLTRRKGAADRNKRCCDTDHHEKTSAILSETSGSSRIPSILWLSIERYRYTLRGVQRGCWEGRKKKLTSSIVLLEKPYREK